MSWHVIRTFGRDHLAETHLRRAGWRTFRPEQHRYFRNARTGKMSDRPIKTSLMQGYVFVRADRLSDLGRLRDVREVCYILGSWNGDRFVPAEIRPDWIDAMEHAGPKIVGKKIPFQKGRRVRLILGKISDMISECEGVDKKGRVLVRVDLLGKSQTVAVDPEHVELAD